MVLSATTTTTTTTMVFWVSLRHRHRRGTVAAGDERWFPLGAEAATIPIPINSNEMRYTIDDNSTVQFYKDFSGTTERIGPYHLSERAQHIETTFTDPYDWA